MADILYVSMVNTCISATSVSPRGNIISCSQHDRPHRPRESLFQTLSYFYVPMNNLCVSAAEVSL
jgi:hypothetical protein